MYPVRAFVRAQDTRTQKKNLRGKAADNHGIPEAKWFGYKQVLMKKIFIDTNIVLDVLGQRAPFYEDAAKLFSLADRGKITLYVSSLTIANANYVLSRLISANDARAVLKKFKVLVTVLALNDKIIELALNDDSFSDFEDGLQYYTALENEADILVTRNLKDFKRSKISVMTASQYLKK